MTMKEKYIAEVERHLPLLLGSLQGKEYSNIADLIYMTVQTSKETVDKREYNASQERRADQARRNANM